MQVGRPSLAFNDVADQNCLHASEFHFVRCRNHVESICQTGENVWIGKGNKQFISQQSVNQPTRKNVRAGTQSGRDEKKCVINRQPMNKLMSSPKSVVIEAVRSLVPIQLIDQPAFHVPPTAFVIEIVAIQFFWHAYRTGQSSGRFCFNERIRLNASIGISE